jgi:phage terminase small subunit
MILRRPNVSRKEIIGLYTESELDFVSTSDAGLIERYCLTYAEYLSLQDVRDEIVARGWDKVKTYHATDELNLDSNINKKLDQLTRMEDRLYLNPLSKNRNVPKKPAKQPEASPLEKAGFGNV